MVCRKFTQVVQNAIAVSPNERIRRLAGAEMIKTVRIKFNGFELGAKVTVKNRLLPVKGLDGAVTASKSAIFDSVNGPEIAANGFRRGDRTIPKNFLVGGRDNRF